LLRPFPPLLPLPPPPPPPHTRLETPFFTGPRRAVAELVATLP
jgi:hypothetical protein